jgi:predicted nucleic acid-binding protein
VIFVLDTNVLSEGRKANPDPAVIKFMRTVPAENFRLSPIVLAEVAQGVENNPTPDLKAFLAEVLALPLVEFGEAEALEWGRMTSKALRSGFSVEARDSLIAATAAVRGWTVATGNTTDFAKLGVLVFDPWKDRLS